MLQRSGPTIDICVITYGRPELALRLAQAFAATPQHARERCRMIVVNNGEAFTSAMTARWPDEVTLSHAGTNLGVAGGRNFAAGLASADLLAFIDDDLELDIAQFIRQIEEDATAMSTWAAIVYQVIRPDGTYHRSEVPHRGGVRSLSHGSCVPYIIGACFVTPRETFLRAGGFSTSFGLYGMEEIEFSYRMISMGARLMYSHRIKIVHLKEEKGRLPSSEQCLQIATGKLRIARTYLPYRYQLTHAVAWLAWLISRTRNPLIAPRLFLRGWKPVDKTPRAAAERKATARRITELGGRAYR